jgi:hypothetical protein
MSSTLRLSLPCPASLARLRKIDWKKWLSVAQAGGARRSEPCQPTISLLVLMTLAVLVLAMEAHFGEELS